MTSSYLDEVNELLSEDLVLDEPHFQILRPLGLGHEGHQVVPDAGSVGVVHDRVLEGLNHKVLAVIGDR